MDNSPMNMSGVSQSDFRGRFESTEPCRLGSVEISFLHGQEQMRFGFFFFKSQPSAVKSAWDAAGSEEHFCTEPEGWLIKPSVLWTLNEKEDRSKHPPHWYKLLSACNDWDNGQDQNYLRIIKSRRFRNADSVNPW